MKLVTIKDRTTGKKHRAIKSEVELVIAQFPDKISYSTKGAYKRQQKDAYKLANKSKKAPNPFGFKAFRKKQESINLKPISLHRSRQLLLEQWNKMGARGLKKKVKALKKWSKAIYNTPK